MPAGTAGAAGAAGAAWAVDALAFAEAPRLTEYARTRDCAKAALAANTTNEAKNRPKTFAFIVILVYHIFKDSASQKPNYCSKENKRGERRRALLFPHAPGQHENRTKHYNKPDRL